MSFSDAANLRVRFSTDGAEATQRQISNVGVAVTGFGKVAGVAGTAVGTALGVVAGAGISKLVSSLGGLVSTGLDFGASMANVNSILQLSDQGLSALSDQVVALTNDPGIRDTPAQLAAGLYDIASAGFTGSDGLTVLTAAAKGASAGVTDTGTAANVLTSVLGAYGLGADQAASVTDMLFQAVNDGKVSFSQLANNMGDVLPIAATYGVGLDEVSAAYAQMTLQGIPVAQAQTQIANVMRTALNPTDALTDAVQSQGYANAGAALEALGLSGYINLINDSAEESGKTLTDYTGSADAANAVMALGGDNADEYADEIDRVKHASDGAGATQKALEKQMKSAAFQIAKAKQSVAALATIVVGGLSPAIAKVASGTTSFIQKGLIPLSKYLGVAFTDGDALNDWLTHFPEPLQRSVHALGSLADSVGDVVRAFGDRGLAGAIKTLTEGGELSQMGTALSALGEEAWNGLVAGFEAIDWGAVWNLAVQPLLSSAANAAIDIGVWTVTVGAPDLIGWIFDQGGNLWDWLKGQMGIGTTTTGDGTGGPESDQRVTLGSWTVDTAIPTVTGFVADVAGDLWGWIKRQMGIGTFTTGDGTGGPESDNKVTLGSWFLDTAVPTVTGWIKDAATGAWPYIKSAAGWAGEQLFDFGVWTLTVGIPDLAGWLYDHKGDAWSAIKDLAGWSLDQAVDLGSWTLNVGAPALGGWIAGLAGGLWGWVKSQLGFGGESETGRAFFPDAGTGNELTLDSWILDVAAPTVGGWIVDIAGDVWGAIKSLAGWTGDFLGSVGDWTLNVPTPDIIGWMSANVGDLWAAIKRNVPGWPDSITGSIDISLDGVFSVADGFLNNAAGAIASATGWIWDHGGSFLWHIVVETESDIHPPSIVTPSNFFEENGFDPNNPPVGPLPWSTGSDGSNLPWGSGQPSDDGGNLPWGGQSITFTVDADTSAAETKINDLKGLFGGGSALGQKAGPGSGFTIPVDVEIDRSKAGADLQAMIDGMKGQYKAQLGADLGPLQDALGTAMKIGVAWNSATFDKAMFGAQYTQVDQASQVSWTLGDAWDGSVHTGQFAGDPSGADSASQVAWLLGGNWDGRVFTASFNADTSGIANAVAVVDAAVAHIAAVLPHSPADEGPLSRPISFSYITDQLATDFSPMRGIAERNMGYLRSAIAAQNKIAALDYSGYGVGSSASMARNGTWSGGVGRQYNGNVYFGPVSQSVTIREDQTAARSRSLASRRR
jgi:TP901 family phage tail tape measure protein